MKSKKKFLPENVIELMFGVGASVVIIGALLKITHADLGPITGNLMLSVGLVTEAIIFAIAGIQGYLTGDSSVEDKGLQTIEAETQNLQSAVDQTVSDEISKPIDFTLNKGNKVVLYSKDSKISSKFYEIINGIDTNYSGEFRWGSTISSSYLPLNNDSYFNKNINLIDWLRQWANNDEEREEVFIRGFLGKMIFSGEEALKSCNVLSGGEKVRCILSKMMMERSNFLMLDEPTNHLDLETIQTLNNSLIKFKGNLILTTHDYEFANSVGNRVIEIGTNGIIDKLMTFEDYLSDNKVKLLREEIY